MLLPGLEGHPQGRVSIGIHGDADDAARHPSHEPVLGRQVGGVRAAIAHGHSETLRVADCDVGPELARGSEQRESHEIGGYDDPGSMLVEGVAEGPVVMHRPVGGRILDQTTEEPVPEGLQIVVVVCSDHDLDIQRRRPALHDLDGLRMTGLGDEEACSLFVSGVTGEHGHGLGGRRALIEERRVRDLQAGEVHHHGLVVQQRLEAPLGDLGLIGRVLCVPTGVLEDVPQDHAWYDRVVVSHPDVGPEDPVFGADLLEPVEKPMLGRGVG